MIRANMIGDSGYKMVACVWYSGSTANIDITVVNLENGTSNGVDSPNISTSPTVTLGDYTVKTSGSSISNATITLTSSVAGTATVTSNGGETTVSVPANTGTTVFTGNLTNQRTTSPVIMFK